MSQYWDSLSDDVARKGSYRIIIFKLLECHSYAKCRAPVSKCALKNINLSILTNHDAKRVISDNTMKHVFTSILIWDLSTNPSIIRIENKPFHNAQCLRMSLILEYRLRKLEFYNYESGALQLHAALNKRSSIWRLRNHYDTYYWPQHSRKAHAPFNVHSVAIEAARAPKWNKKHQSLE